MRLSRGLALTAMAVAALVGTSMGQMNQSPVFSNGKAPFPNPFAPFKTTNVAKPNFTNSPRIDQLLKDGKLMLSLDDAIALALENNLDLAIARYNLPIADTDILRTKSGAVAQGVNFGIVQGTPGGQTLSPTGASGGGAGGTSTAAGGVGAGAGGIVTSSLGAGPAPPQFDPVLSSNLNLQHTASQQTNPFIFGSTDLRQNTGTANFSYTQGFATGTAFSLGFNNQRLTTNSVRSDLSPALSSNFQIQFQQHLLQGFSIGTNRRFIRIARNNREISDVAFRLQVITTVVQIENIYWDLVNAYEDVKAKQRALDLANRLLADNQKQVQIGTLAPIEVVRARSQVASASQDLIVSQTNLQLQQLLTKNALSRNLTDPQLMAAEVIPTDTMQVPTVEPVVPTQDLISEALSHRAELAEGYIDLTNREINNKAAKNGLLPGLDLVASYGGSGLAGVPNPLSPAPGITTTTGYFDALSRFSDFPNYLVGLQLNIPVRNRQAQASQMRSELEYRQAQMRLQQLENTIRIQVRNAQFALQQNRARVDAAIKGRELAYETMSAEQKKYALGASTTYNVLQTQQALAAAESNLITAMAAYEQSKVAMDQTTGTTLAKLGIELEDAVSGNVRKLPHVPGVVPNANVSATPLQPTATPALPQQTPPQTPAPVPQQPQTPPPPQQ
jgi:outer membrane protein